MKPITKYPHPVTDAMVNKFDGNQSKLAADAISLCEILERKLAACRDTLACINSSQILPGNIHDEIGETIKATAP